MRQGSVPVVLVIIMALLAGWPPVLAQAASPAPAVPAQPQAPVPSPIPAGPGGLAFTRDDSIYYLPPGAKQPIRLRPGRSAALSPDGRRLAFRAEPPKNGAAGEVGVSLGPGLAVREISSGRETLILKAESEEVVRHSVWSPAGDRLAFVARTGLKVQLSLVQADGSGRRPLYSQGDEDNFGSIAGLVWGPDGKSLWFHDNHELFQVSDTGAILAKTLLDTIMGKAPADLGIISSTDRFVPNPADPQLLAFTKTVKAPRAFEKAFPDDLPGISALFLYDSRSQKRTRLTPKDMHVLHPCWSRDGQYLYFTGFRQPHYKEKEPLRIYRINRNGRDLQEITKGRDPSL